MLTTGGIKSLRGREVGAGRARMVNKMRKRDGTIETETHGMSSCKAKSVATRIHTRRGTIPAREGTK